MTIEKIARAARDTTIDLKRAAMPMTTRWMLMHTLPNAVGKAVQLAFTPHPLHAGSRHPNSRLQSQAHHRDVVSI